VELNTAWCEAGLLAYTVNAMAGVPVRVPEREPVRQLKPARVREIGVHPYFQDYANRFPVFDAPGGRDFIVAIDAGLFAQVVAQAEVQRLEQTRRAMRVDPRNVRFIQVEPVLIGGAIVAGIVAIPLLLYMLAPVVVGLVEAAAAAAAATAAATSVAALTESAAFATFSKATAAGVVAWLLKREMVSNAEAAEQTIAPLVGKRITAVIDVTANPEIGAKPGAEINAAGQSFRTILRLTSRPF
jgi:membrane protein implicated in regulation of membrane protease activity